MVAARPAVVRYTPDHSHGPSRCQESDRPTSIVYALLMYLPAGDSQECMTDLSHDHDHAPREIVIT